MLMKLVLVEMNDTMRIYPRYCTMNHLNHCHRHYSHVVEGLNDCVNYYNVKYPSQDEDCRARAYPQYSDMTFFVVAVPVGAVRLLCCPWFCYTSHLC